MHSSPPRQSAVIRLTTTIRKLPATTPIPTSFWARFQPRMSPRWKRRCSASSNMSRTRPPRNISRCSWASPQIKALATTTSTTTSISAILTTSCKVIPTPLVMSSLKAVRAVWTLLAIQQRTWSPRRSTVGWASSVIAVTAMCRCGSPQTSTTAMSIR